MGVKRSHDMLKMTDNETRIIDFDWTDNNDLGTGETLSAISEIRVTPSGSLSTTDGVVNSPMVQVTIRSGTENTEYIVSAVVTTSLGQTLEGEVLVWVGE